VFTRKPSLEEITGSLWFRAFESATVLYAMYYVFSHVLRSAYQLYCVMIPAALLALYAEAAFKSPWPRILLPFSLGNTVMLASIMLAGTIPAIVYAWVVAGYAIAVFALFHALSRMLMVFLWERRSRFRSIVEGSMIDAWIFAAVFTALTAVLAYYRAVMLPYAAILVASAIALPILTVKTAFKFIIPSLMERRLFILGYTHPREPEVEEVYFKFSSATVLFALIIPALMAYTSTSLERRAFIPMAVLLAYEAVIMVYYTITLLVSLHGAFIETLLGDKLVPVEKGEVARKWRDVAWFVNTSLIYYVKMKYFSALITLLQGLEVLSRRTGDRDVYYGSLYTLLEQGYSKIAGSSGLSKYVLADQVERVMEDLKPENTYVVEPKWRFLENTGFEESFKVAMGCVVNVYCKIRELGGVDPGEYRRALETAAARLEKLASRAPRDVAAKLRSVAGKLREYSSVYNPTVLEEFVERVPLTVNMLRNYLVHGQLFKNAVVHQGSRVSADRVFGKPGTLYALYTLIFAAVTAKHPELLSSS